MSTEGSFRIRPAGRHILTIGRDLIQDPYAAVVELVKNSYDADSPDVHISFEGNLKEKTFRIVVSDNGHGMSREDVISRWMVPSTSGKIVGKTSPGGRVMQGRKGIGRYAASILGEDLLLETTTRTGETTSIFVEWKLFEDAEFLEDVELLIETENCDLAMGTSLTIAGGKTGYKEWDDQQFRKLRYELKKLVPPISDNASEEGIQIWFGISGFGAHDTPSEVIEPFPILDFFDYRISGTIGANGVGRLCFSTQKFDKNSVDEYIDVDFSHQVKNAPCGDVYIDIRVFDRDTDSISKLIFRGLKDDKGSYLKQAEARAILNENNGIGVYRNGFRIRPLGDASFDWLQLNKKRIQNPSRSIGSDQVIGFVHIQSEEKSHLIEKSARDGLRENLSFASLMHISSGVIGEIELRRFKMRRQLGLGKSKAKVDRQIQDLFSDDSVTDAIVKALKTLNASDRSISMVKDILEKETDRKNKVAENIRQAVAIYQGQATLGKIINVVLHEGRHPLNFFKNQIPNLIHWEEKYRNNPTKDNLSKVLPIAHKLGNNADIFVKLFRRLDPLAAGRRSNPKVFGLEKVLDDVTAVFQHTIEINEVSINLVGFEGCEIYGWHQDFYAIFTNLMDNSLYWMNKNPSSVSKILIRAVMKDGVLDCLDFEDTGLGISMNEMEGGLLFEPEFSTKPNGTGLGLAIAGEAAARNGFSLSALPSDLGAHLQLKRLEEDQGDEV